MVSGSGSKKLQGRRPTALVVCAAVALSYGACGRPLRPDKAGAGSDDVPVNGDCGATGLAPRRILRLSLGEYARSVRSLLGAAREPIVEPAPSPTGNLPDPLIADDGASIDPALALQLASAAHGLLAQADLGASETECLAAETEDQCAADFARRFGRMAFRRPLATEEVTDLLAVYADGRQQSFVAGVNQMAEALLLSPSFLFRTELGDGSADPTTLSSYEVASQLSFTLTGSTPDPALLDAAGDGRLVTADGVAAEADRLLATDVARANMDRVIAAWFHGREIYQQNKDAGLLAAVGGAMADQEGIQGDLYTSLLAFVENRLQSGVAHLTDLMGSPAFMVNQRLATLYGLPFTGGDPQAFVYTLSGDDTRAGLLTQPAFLWAVTDAAASPIVRRGIALRADVYCADPVPSPAGLHSSPDVQARLMAEPNEIARSDDAISSAPCSTCHAIIDPFGRVLEGFDAIGGARTTVDGATIDPTGDFTSVPPLAGTITGAPAFAQAIIADQQLARCAVKQLAGHALARAQAEAAACSLQRIGQRVIGANGDVDIRAVFREVALDASMRARGGTTP